MTDPFTGPEPPCDLDDLAHMLANPEGCDVIGAVRDLLPFLLLAPEVTEALAASAHRLELDAEQAIDQRITEMRLQLAYRATVAVGGVNRALSEVDRLTRAARARAAAHARKESTP